jgi:hypothetical protein
MLHIYATLAQKERSLIGAGPRQLSLRLKSWGCGSGTPSRPAKTAAKRVDTFAKRLRPVFELAGQPLRRIVA